MGEGEGDGNEVEEEQSTSESASAEQEGENQTKEELERKLQQICKYYNDCKVHLQNAMDKIKKMEEEAEERKKKRQDAVMRAITLLVFDEEKEVVEDGSGGTGKVPSARERKDRLIKMIPDSVKVVVRRECRIAFESMKFVNKKTMANYGLLLHIFSKCNSTLDMVEMVRLVEPVRVYCAARFTDMKRCARDRFAKKYICKFIDTGGTSALVPLVTTLTMSLRRRLSDVVLKQR